jgi:hypothetical protein
MDRVRFRVHVIIYDNSWFLKENLNIFGLGYKMVKCEDDGIRGL